MLFYVLAAAALALAALLWYVQAARAAGEALTPALPPEPPEIPPALAEAVGDAVEALAAVMAHPKLGGPGFLLVCFPSREGAVTVTAQYPNIREGLYRRIVRRELEPAELTAAGVPEALFSMSPVFETESGGVVVLSLQTGVLPPALARALDCRRERGILLDQLARALGERLPGFSVRPFGADLLLSPEREEVPER